jgi:hypothetical protein
MPNCALWGRSELNTVRGSANRRIEEEIRE